MTKEAARTEARRRSMRYPDRCYYVVRESGEYEVANESDLDTFFDGIDALECWMHGEVQ